MAMKVVDISKHNGTVAWAALKSADITGVIIRAGYGNVIDPLWTTNYAGAVKNGFKVGVYWFAYPLSAAGAQAEADTCWGAIGGKQLDLGVYYDYEYDSTDYLKRKGIKETKQLVTDMMKAFIGRMKTHGVNCGIYVNRDYIQNHMYYNELKQYPLWQAAWVTNGYTSYDVVTQGQKPSTYKIVCWQFGKGYLGGKVFDLNYYYGEVDSGEDNKDYASLVCAKAGLEDQTREYLDNYKWAKYLWEKLWKAMQ